MISIIIVGYIGKSTFFLSFDGLILFCSIGFLPYDCYDVLLILLHFLMLVCSFYQKN